jgi:UDP-N-acetylglucosamine 4-epimerase
VDFYLITGGAGFIGSNIALRLAKAKQRVRLLDNFSFGLSRSAMSSMLREYGDLIEIVDADVRDFTACLAALKDVTHVIHHASVASASFSIDDPNTTVSVNVLGTSNLLTAARDRGTVTRFVNASSCAVYGDGPSSAKSESAMLHPGTVFATTMLTSEDLCENFFRTNQLCAGSLRYFNVYGESEFTTGRIRSAVSRIVDSALQGAEISINGRGQQTRDFVHIDDAVDAAILACTCEDRFIAGQTYNVGTGERTSILELLEFIEKEIGHPLECVATPLSPHALLHSRADMGKAKAMLQFKPKITLTEGVRRMTQLQSTKLKAA